MKRLFLIIIILFLSNTALFCQTQTPAGTHRVYMTTGYDYAFLMTSFGYSYTFSLTPARRNLTLFGDFGEPLFDVDAGDYRVRCGGEIALLQLGKLAMPLQAAFVFRGIGDHMVSITGLGSEFALHPGYYSDKWSLAGEFICDNQWANYLDHKSEYKKIYPGVKDGWYSSDARTVRMGGKVSALFFSHLDLSFAAGCEYNGRLTLSVVPPVYGVIGAGWGF